MQQIIASFGVAHTTINTGSIAKSLHFLPLTTYYFPDGLYIISANNNYSNLLGKKVLGVNGTDISIVHDSLKTIISHENDYWVKALFSRMLNYLEVLKYFGFANIPSSANLQLEGIGDVTINALQIGSSNNLIYINAYCGKICS